MADVNDAILTHKELFELAVQCAVDPSSIVGYLPLTNGYQWSWQVDDTDASFGLLCVSVEVDPDHVAKEGGTGRTWIRPHQLTILQRLPDNTAGEPLEYRFPPELLGIDPGGVPRRTLATLIAKQPLPTAA